MSFLTFTLSFLPSSSTSAIVQKFIPSAIDEARTVFDNFGPTARLCIDYVQHPLQFPFYESRRQAALANFSMRHLVQGVEETRDLKSAVSDTLFLIRRMEEKLNPRDVGYFQYYTVEPVTRHDSCHANTEVQTQGSRAWGTVMCLQTPRTSGSVEAVGRPHFRVDGTAQISDKSRAHPCPNGKGATNHKKGIRSLEISICRRLGANVDRGLGRSGRDRTKRTTYDQLCATLYHPVPGAHLPGQATPLARCIPDVSSDQQRPTRPDL